MGAVNGCYHCLHLLLRVDGGHLPGMHPLQLEHLHPQLLPVVAEQPLPAHRAEENTGCHDDVVPVHGTLCLVQFFKERCRITDGEVRERLAGVSQVRIQVVDALLVALEARCSLQPRLLLNEEGERFATHAGIGDLLRHQVAALYLSEFRHVAEYVDMPHPLLLAVCQLLVVLPFMPRIQECIAHFAAV